MPRYQRGQTIKVGYRNGRAWIGTRTFDGIEADITENLSDLDLREVKFIIGELGKLLPEMEASALAENEKRRIKLLSRRQEIETQLKVLDRELRTLSPSTTSARSIGSSINTDAAHICPVCGQHNCDGEGVGHYRG